MGGEGGADQAVSSACSQARFGLFAGGNKLALQEQILERPLERLRTLWYNPLFRDFKATNPYSPIRMCGISGLGSVIRMGRGRDVKLP